MEQATGSLFAVFLDAAPDAMVCARADGRIAHVNTEAERLFGYRRDELVGRPVETLVPESLRPGHAAHRAAYMANPCPRPMRAGLDLAGRRADGGTFPAEISLSALDTPDGPLILAAVRDISERLELRAERELLQAQAERDRMERQVQQSQRLESLGQLAGGVAHDFNNLLAVISNYAAFVHEEAEKDTQLADLAAIRDDVEQIEQAAGRAAGLTRQLLAFSRRDVMKPQPLNLNDIVRNIEQLLVRTLGEHVELSTSLPAGLRPVLADPGQIEQVLVNLAVNARDAMAGGGTLTIETANADVDAAYAANRVGLAPGRYAAMKVSDNGAGMTRDVAEHAFEPFFTTKPKGEGTGLGLATVYGIVVQAGGYIQIYSEPGVGTTVAMLLPATEEVASEAEAPPAGAAQGGGETVLVVEDEDGMREVTRRILARNGYKVITAANGREAVDLAGTHPGEIDLMLSDVIMPQMAGKEAADRISEIRPGIKVLFMSGYTQGILGKQGVLADGVHLVEKPFTETSLLVKVREVMSSSLRAVRTPMTESAGGIRRAEASVTFPVFGTTATLVVTDPGSLGDARSLVCAHLARVDLVCSRFRDDSELSRLNAAAGTPVSVSPLFAAALDVALRAARLSDGDVDPTCGRALTDLGYDRDFGEISAAGVRTAAVAAPAPGWQQVDFEPGRAVVRLPAGVVLDLGATAKAWASDLCAEMAATTFGCGVLVSIGGDVAAAGPAPEGGWQIRVTDDDSAPAGAPAEIVAITGGGLATSSTTVRQWVVNDRAVHHIIDPRTGMPAESCWRTASVAAATCADANTASTAAIIRGDAAPRWLEELGLPARLVRADGSVVRLAGWPATPVAIATLTYSDKVST